MREFTTVTTPLEEREENAKCKGRGPGGKRSKAEVASTLPWPLISTTSMKFEMFLVIIWFWDTAKVAEVEIRVSDFSLTTEEGASVSTRGAMSKDATRSLTKSAIATIVFKYFKEES